MKYLQSSKISGLAMCIAVLSTACSDAGSSPSVDRSDASAESDAGRSSDASWDDTASTSPTPTAVLGDAGTTDTDATNVSSPDADVTSEPGSTRDGDASTGEVDTSGEPSSSDDQTGAPAPVFAQVPATLPVAGCGDIGPLCTVVQDGSQLSVNCGGRRFTGSITEARDVTLATGNVVDGQGATVATTCTGKLSARGKITARCTTTTTPAGGDATTATCNLESDTAVLPSVECAEVPSQLRNVVLCSDAECVNENKINLGDCSVAQDACAFQAECGDVTLTGEVRGDELRFTQALGALADAQAADGAEPAFRAGDEVDHSCITTVNAEGVLSGECGAGGSGRGGVNTSVWTVTGAAPAPVQCELLAPKNELIFALDSCDNLKHGSEGEPGIGEPLCAFRQNNCIWEIQCGRDLLYTGRIQPGAKSFDWRLETGTRCDGSFDAQGEFSGVCAVPGLFSCNLGSKDFAPGGEECPSAPINESTVTSRGCGNGNGQNMNCRELAWHGCDFMAICSFSYLNSLVFAGTASEVNGAGYLSFNGIGDYECAVTGPTVDDLQNDQWRKANEWIGQCETPEGGLCRSNFNPDTGSGFRGLQLFWGQSEVEN
jgi:hypothetical protein